MARAVGACVHCGFCLPTCPTYQVLEEEMDSPRGRIFLMKEVLEGALQSDDVAAYIDRCLGCLACETSCPSGVSYRELVTPFRARLEESRRRRGIERLRRFLALQTLPFPKRFRLAVRLGLWARRLERLVPKSMRPMLGLLPPALPRHVRLPERTLPLGEPRARVALLAGCAQRVLAPSINTATIRVLAQNGVEVLVPRLQGCCGALSLHSGEERQAKRFALRLMQKFPADVDAIVTNAAGCGSGMHEYEQLFRGTPHHGEAAAFSRRVKDVQLFLAELGLRTPAPRSRSIRVVYQDACHLAHAQSVQSAPRKLLEAIDGVEVSRPDEAEICCGSAGMYNVEQPEIAAQLGRRKVARLLEAKPDLIVSANIGCITQLHAHLQAEDVDVAVVHVMEFLDWAYAGSEPVDENGSKRPVSLPEDA